MRETYLFVAIIRSHRFIVLPNHDMKLLLILSGDPELSMGHITPRYWEEQEPMSIVH